MLPWQWSLRIWAVCGLGLASNGTSCGWQQLPACEVRHTARQATRALLPAACLWALLQRFKTRVLTTCRWCVSLRLSHGLCWRGEACVALQLPACWLWCAMQAGWWPCRVEVYTTRVEQRRNGCDQLTGFRCVWLKHLHSQVLRLHRWGSLQSSRHWLAAVGRVVTYVIGRVLMGFVLGRVGCSVVSIVVP